MLSFPCLLSVLFSFTLIYWVIYFYISPVGIVCAYKHKQVLRSVPLCDTPRLCYRHSFYKEWNYIYIYIWRQEFSLQVKVPLTSKMIGNVLMNLFPYKKDMNVKLWIGELITYLWLRTSVYLVLPQEKVGFTCYTIFPVHLQTEDST